MALIQNTDTPEQAAERLKMNVLVRDRLTLAAEVAERLAKRLREGAEHLKSERAADGGPLLPEEYHFTAARQMLEYLQRLERHINCEPGAETLPGV